MTTTIRDKFKDPKLKEKFKKLTTIDEKLKFWNQELRQSYCGNYLYTYQEMKDFLIETNDKDEIKKVNKYIIEGMARRYNTVSYPKKYEDFNYLIEYLNKDLETAINPIERIQKDIARIKEIVEAKKDMKVNPMARESNYYYLEGFNYYFKHEVEPPNDERIYEPEQIMHKQVGVEQAKYLCYLLQTEVQLLKDGKQKRLTPLRTQLALLDSIDVLENIKSLGEKTIVAEFLSILLNSSKENIRKALSDRDIWNDELKSKDNIKVEIYRELEEIYSKLGRKDLSEKIKDQLDK